MQDKTNKKFWQRFARLYAPLMERDKRFYASICDLIRPELKPDMDVLELACGSGQLSIPLSPAVHSWLATDYSENMIRAAKARGETGKLHYAVADATRLKLSCESFDAALIANALHIMPEPEKALAEIHRVLKPGGLLYAPTFLWKEGRSTSLRRRLMTLAGFKIYREWNSEEFREFVSKAGFEVTSLSLVDGGLVPVGVLLARKIRVASKSPDVCH